MFRILNMIKQSIATTIKGNARFAFIRQSIVSTSAFIGTKTRFYSSEINRYSYTGNNGFYFKTKIGAFSSIADNCNCGMPEHAINGVSTSPTFYKGKNRFGTHFSLLNHPSYKETIIGNDVWIGDRVSIKAGVTIGDGSVVGMSSVVVKDVPPYSVVAGNPARVIRYRFDDETIQKLQDLQWWNWEESRIKRYGAYFFDPTVLIDIIEKEGLNGETQ